MRHLVAPLLVALLIGPGCSGITEGRANPANWFGGQPTRSIEPDGGYPVLQTDARQLIDQVTGLTVEPTPGGVIVRAEGLAPTQGYWSPGLVRVDGGDGTAPVLAYEFRVLPPVAATTVGSARSRTIRAGDFVSEIELSGVRQITVAGRQASRSIRR